MRKIFERLFREEEGQGLVEYGLIIALVAVVLIGALAALRGGLAGIFEDATTALESPDTAGESSD